MNLLAFDPEYLFTYTATLGNVELIGPLPEGIRANYYVSGGTITGPKLNGTVRPVGADWYTMDSDGCGLLDVRITLESHDGALIYTTYTGFVDLGEDGYRQFAEGRIPPRFPIRTALRLRTAHAAYKWLNRLQCIGIGEADLSRSEVRYDVYALR